jgi:hypothetical protein
MRLSAIVNKRDPLVRQPGAYSGPLGQVGPPKSARVQAASEYSVVLVSMVLIAFFVFNDNPSYVIAITSRWSGTYAQSPSSVIADL